MISVHKELRSESGASAVEFALLLPVLMMILFGIIEFGMALYRQAILTNASREGARLGIVQSIPAITTGQIDAAIDNYLTAAGVAPGNVARNIVSGGVTGTPVQVTLTLPYTYAVLPGLTSIAPTINLTAQTVMRHE
ncbi:MAG TPA: TadE/TadG family type IV pilus assembly protein [Nitrospiraceae bacterium]|nr:TadE/TadG family type IV pilus assembly protein [Nitrospiraceae bacterium]